MIRGIKKTPPPLSKAKGDAIKECSIVDCRKPAQRHGYCWMHRSRLQRRGDPNVVQRQHENHHLTGHPIYPIWLAMRDRCNNPRNKVYEHYGGRGITVCERWRGSFQSFYEDVAPRPEGLTLDREDNDLGYWCGKCEECITNGWPKNWRWATWNEQSLNKRIRNDSITGFKCVSRVNNRYRAYIVVNHKRVHLGYYATPEKASAAYEAAKKKLLRDKLL